MHPDMTGERSISWPPKGPPGLSDWGTVKGTQAEPRGLLKLWSWGSREARQSSGGRTESGGRGGWVGEEVSRRKN